MIIDVDEHIPDLETSKYIGCQYNRYASRVI